MNAEVKIDFEEHCREVVPENRTVGDARWSPPSHCQIEHRTMAARSPATRAWTIKRCAQAGSTWPQRKRPRTTRAKIPAQLLWDIAISKTVYDKVPHVHQINREDIMKRLAVLIALISSPSYAGPSHCWYYMHEKTKLSTIDQCVSKAERALNSRGYVTEVRNSSDDYITFVRAKDPNVSADVLCYEVNGSRGKVLAFITVAGRSSCNVARDIVEKMSTNN